MWWRTCTFMGIIFGIIVFILPNIAWLFSWIIGKAISFKVPYQPFMWVGITLVLIIWGALVYGHYIGRFKLEVNQVEYASKEVPNDFDGYKIIQISDLHVDSFNDHPEALQKFADSVNAQQPDIILFTGDMSTMSMSSIKNHEKALKTFHARQGVVSVLGNHDFFIYHPEYDTNVKRIQAANRLTAYERNVLGWKVLRNASIVLKAKGNGNYEVANGSDSINPVTDIAIAGVDNINGNQGFKTIQMGDLKKALTDIRGMFTILMTHDPSHWEAEVLPKSKVQITLSGHTHAAQARVFGWSFAHFTFKECDGRYDKEGRMLYVNAGTGCTAPFRVNCPSEITVITLRSKQ